MTSTAATLMLLKPEIVAHPVILQKVLHELATTGIQIKAAKHVRLSRTQATQLYHMHQGKFFFPRLVRHVSSGPIIALEVIGDVRQWLGSSRVWPLDPTLDQTLRQRLALSDVRNVAHNSDPPAAQAELELFRPFDDKDHVLDKFSKLEQPSDTK